MKERDEQLRRLAEDLNEARSQAARTRAAPAASPAGKPGNEPPDAAKWAYMRNLVLRYLGTADPAVRHAQEPALMMLFGFGADDKKEVARLRATEGGAGAEFGAITSLFGSFGGVAAAPSTDG